MTRRISALLLLIIQEIISCPKSSEKQAIAENRITTARINSNGRVLQEQDLCSKNNGYYYNESTNACDKCYVSCSKCLVTDPLSRDLNPLIALSVLWGVLYKSNTEHLLLKKRNRSRRALYACALQATSVKRIK